jgi:uncharacterized protein (DUF1810 family)
MEFKDNLKRFVDAQEGRYQDALTEIKNGRKRTHWMWFIFPQLLGLGFSETSRYYAISNLEEAAAYLAHPLLGPRLITICKELLQLAENNAGLVFGSPDNMKLKSSMTLFAAVPGADPVFEAVLNKFFKGEKDVKTLSFLKV